VEGMSATCPRVKICGITNLDDAEMAVELGAWALGMIFFEDSPRRCSAAEAQRIVATLRRKVELCGVFVNAPLEQVVRSGEDLGLTMLQFSGEEGPAFCAEAARRNGARVIKGAQVSGPGDVRDLERFHVDFHLLDARAKAPGRQALRGGTGETFDWRLVQARRSKVPLILSGGLRAENVGDAIGLTNPYAVDTASGTEAAPGRKDPEKLRAFFDAVERFSAQPEVQDTPQHDAPDAPEQDAPDAEAVERSSLQPGALGAPQDEAAEVVPAASPGAPA
jgi:phosphoribosylanthranilate isomerase